MLKVWKDEETHKAAFELVGVAAHCCVQGYCQGKFSMLLLATTGFEMKIKDWSVLPTRLIQKAMRIVRQANEKIEGINKPNDSGREPIPDDVRMYVWQRDGGKCVKCGSQEKLEYDHIIPISQGSSNTAHNIQLLCETCNRSKGGSII